MSNAKTNKKRAKSARLLDVVAKYNFLFLGVFCHLLVMILLSLSAEFRAMIGPRYETLIDGLAVVAIVALAILLLMRWTYPMSNEEPLIILLLWILLSSRITPDHCFCCHGGGGAGGRGLVLDGVDERLLLPHHHQGAPGGMPDPNATGLASAHPADAANQHLTGGAEGAAGPAGEADYLVEAWQAAFEDCRPESFNFFYSLLCAVLLGVAFFSELRNYWVSLAFRLTTVLVIALVLLLLVVSPSLCSKFSITVEDSFVTVVRITLYEVLWWLNKKKRVGERILQSEYSDALQMTTRWFNERRTGGRALPLRVCATPRDLFDDLYGFFGFLARKYGEEGGRAREARGGGGGRRREASQLILPMKGGGGGAEEESESSEEASGEYDFGEEDGEASDSDEAAVPRSNHRRAMRKRAPRAQNIIAAAGGGEAALARAEDGVVRDQVLRAMARLEALNDEAQESFLASLVSWKNRAYSKHILHLIDLSLTAWILVVCPYWIILAALELLWFYYYLAHNEAELCETRKYVRLLEACIALPREGFDVFIS